MSRRMPFVPMPGAMPRSYSFRSGKSERTLDQKSIAQESSSNTHNNQSTLAVSTAMLPRSMDDNEYDTPYREEYKEVIGGFVPATTTMPKKTKSKRQLKIRKSFQQAMQKKKPVIHKEQHHAYHEDEEASFDDDTENLPNYMNACYTKEAAATAEDAASTTTSVKSTAHHDLNHNYRLDNGEPTIALFGATGVTGGHFLTTALDAGYNVQCIPNDDPREHQQICGAEEEAARASFWGTLKSSLEDAEQIRQAVHQVDYVVVMLNDVIPGKHEYPAGFLTAFIERLYTVLRDEPTIQVVLFQATSLAIDVRGHIPVMSKVIKSVAHRRNAFLRDQDAAIHRIGTEHGLRHFHDDENRSITLAPPHFHFIVSRPSVILQDGPSSKKLSASKSQPGPYPVTHIDLADFSLNALTTEKIYNSSPYVVADIF